MNLYIKYMVSYRCKMVVRDELNRLGLCYDMIDLGIVHLDTITLWEREQLRLNLLPSGLELLDDKKSILVEKIKHVVIEMVHNAIELPQHNYSEFISQQLGYDYTYLANIFSEVQGTTTQQFIIVHKIEKVKELLMYDELNLTEIAWKLHYSSVAHLSNQFKKVTGLTPSFFKHMKQKKRTALENV